MYVHVYYNVATVDVFLENIILSAGLFIEHSFSENPTDGKSSHDR